MTAIEAAMPRLPPLAGRLGTRWSAAATPAARVGVLALCGRLKQPELVPLLRDAAADDDPTLCNAALRALGQWSDPAAMTPLAAAAHHADPTSRRLAQRGLAQVLRQARAAMPAEERARRCAEVAPLIEHPDDARLLLATLGEIPHPVAVAVADGLVAREDVRAEAEQAVLRIAGALPSVDETTRAALRRIVESSASEDRRNDARALLGVGQ